MMEIRAFAEKVLWGASLRDKLETPDELTDHAPGAAVSFPEAPARPQSLPFPEEPLKSAAPAVPTRTELESSPAARGRLLHAFANHELLALELMAVCLLRFPDSPRTFRRSLAHTMGEEQKHMRLYIERMEELGVPFGSQPLTRFFWDCLDGFESPLDFVIRMSLTLEQANLDYARYYLNLFGELGDEKTQRILQTVYEEEIGHVRLGAQWFEKWRPGQKTAWQEFKDSLRHPLTPNRAKGHGFDEDARKRAGLDDTYIRELKVYRHSKGRRSRGYLFNPGCEEEIAEPAASHNATGALRSLESDLAPIMMFLAGADDVVFVAEPPRKAFLERLLAAGVELPRFVSPEEGYTLDPRRLLPWGQSPHLGRTLKRRKIQLETMDHADPQAGAPEVGGEGGWGVYSKLWGRRAAELLGIKEPESAVCASFEEARERMGEILEGRGKGILAAVVKAPLGASGRNMVRIRAPGPKENQANWMRRTLERQGCLIIEPWHERVADLSVQMNVANGRKMIAGVTRFLTDKRGQYLGHVVGRMWRREERELQRFFYEHEVKKELEGLAAKIAEKLEENGYRGPAGLDAYIYRCGGGPRLRSLVEVNPRHTMGHVALGLEKLVSPKTPAVWLHWNQRLLREAGYASFRDYARFLDEQHTIEKEKGRIKEGALCTNDPEQASSTLTVLYVGEAAGKAMKIIEHRMGTIPEESR